MTELQAVICAKCGAGNVGGKFCHQCGAALGPTAKPQPTAADTRRGCLMLLGLLGAIVAGVLIWAATTHESGDDWSKRFCHAQVKEQLKSPSSAEFSDDRLLSTVPGDPAGTTYSRSGYVDADNSFGAHVRSLWTCQATVRGKKIYLDNIDVEGG